MTPSILSPSDVGIILGYRCQAACKHCIYNCGPKWQNWMSPTRLQEAMHAVLTWPQPVQVHITGGEPFLRFDLLLEAVQKATELGIPRYAETNAGWCVNEELAVRRLTDLKQAGLQALLISCSPFHAEMIPPRRTRLALTTAQEILGPDRVILYLPEWLSRLEGFGADRTTPLECYTEAVGPAQAGQLFWEGYGLMAGGRSGYELGHLVPKQAPGAFRGLSCVYELLFAQHSHMDLYGNYIPGFCGGLALGKWHDLPRLRARFEAGRFPPLVKTLIDSGPFGLYEMAKWEYDYQPLSEGYAGKCHLCVDVRCTLVKQGTFAELEPVDFYDSF